MCALCTRKESKKFGNKKVIRMLDKIIAIYNKKAKKKNLNFIAAM